MWPNDPSSSGTASGAKPYYQQHQQHHQSSQQSQQQQPQTQYQQQRPGAVAPDQLLPHNYHQDRRRSSLHHLHQQYAIKSDLYASTSAGSQSQQGSVQHGGSVDYDASFQRPPQAPIRRHSARHDSLRFPPPISRSVSPPYSASFDEPAAVNMSTMPKTRAYSMRPDSYLPHPQQSQQRRHSQLQHTGSYNPPRRASHSPTSRQLSSPVLGTSSSPDHHLASTTTTVATIENRDIDSRRVRLIKHPTDPKDAGLTLCGGPEVGLHGIYISRIKDDSIAATCGLQPGDQILAANYQSFLSGNMSCRQAYEMICDSETVILTILPRAHALSTQRRHHCYSWTDTDGRPVSPPPPDDCDSDIDTLAAKASSLIVDSADPATAYRRKSHTGLPSAPSSTINEYRRVTITMEKGISLGLMIRGGLEYGLGIYVTGIDKGSLSERVGLKIGDQILSVNNYDFRQVMHDEAVDVLKSSPRLNMTLRYIGKIPNFPVISKNTTQTAVVNPHPTRDSIDRDSNSSPGPLTSPPNMLETSRAGSAGAAAVHYPDYPGVPITHCAHNHSNTYPSQRSYHLHRQQFDYAPYNQPIPSSNLSIRGNQAQQRRPSRVGFGQDAGNNGQLPERSKTPALLVTDSEEEAVLDQKLDQLLSHPERMDFSFYRNEYDTKSMSIESFTNVLFDLFDTPDKYLLLNLVRNLIRKEDLDAFDQMLYKRDHMANLRALSMQRRKSSSVAPVGVNNGAALGPNHSGSYGDLEDDVILSATADDDLDSIDLNHAGPNNANETRESSSSTGTGSGSAGGISSKKRYLPTIMGDPMMPDPMVDPYQGSRLTVGDANRNLIIRRHSSTAAAAGDASANAPKSGSGNLLGVDNFADERRWSIAAQEVPGMAHASSYTNNALLPGYTRPSDHHAQQQKARSLSGELRHLSVHEPPPLATAASTLAVPGADMSGGAEAAAQRAASGNHLHVPDEAYNNLIPGFHSRVRRHRSLPSPFVQSPTGSPTHENHHTSHARSSSFRLPQSMNPKIIKDEKGAWRVTIKKTKPILGLAIEGGADIPSQIQPRIISIHPTGAAFNCSELRSGNLILEVNGKSTEGMTHEQVAKLIADAFYHSSRDSIDFKVREKHKNEFDIRRSSIMLLNNSFDG